MQHDSPRIALERKSQTVKQKGHNTPICNPSTPTSSADLNKMLRAEVGTQVNNLPRAQTNKHTHSAEREPLHTLIGALVGIT